MLYRFAFVTFLLFMSVLQIRCQEDDKKSAPDGGREGQLYLGGDLSYVNQILDKGGVYKVGGVTTNPYEIFKAHGANLVRLRLWHNPTWTSDIYGAGGQLYNDLGDVEKAIRSAKEQGMEVLLDFHYSDNWADPGKQEVPEAWKAITQLSVLKDSVFQYTRKTLLYLDSRGLMPELVQIGNETNCGMLYTAAPAGFPSCNVCTGAQWQRLGEVINSAIAAVSEVRTNSSVKTKILLHVADPKNVDWWFNNITGTGAVSAFDIIGFSYYPLWHRTVALDALSESVAEFKRKFGRPVMILETAYPWTTEFQDDYGNHFGNETPIAGFPFTPEGQRDMLIRVTQEVVDGGGIGVVYWEPAWISTPGLKDQWGQGSAWENNTFFDFQGNALGTFEFMTHDYKK